MRHTCLDNLVFGKKCRTEVDSIYLYKISPDYKRSPEVSDEMRSILQAGLTICKLCNLTFMHDRGDDTFVHINPTCVNVINNRPCLDVPSHMDRMAPTFSSVLPLLLTLPFFPIRKVQLPFKQKIAFLIYFHDWCNVNKQYQR